jgi:O-antigen ligase
MVLKHTLGIFTFLLFLYCFHKGENRKNTYLIFVACLFPFIDLHITNDDYGTISVFDGITYYTAAFLFKDVIVGLSFRRIYLILFCTLSITLFVGSIQSEFHNSLISAIKYVSIFIYGKFLIDTCIENPAFVPRIIKCFKIISLISVAFLAVQLVVGLDFTYYELNQNTLATGRIRYPGFFADPQIFSQYLAMSSFLFLIRNDDDTERDLLYNRICILLIIIAILLTGGRGGFLGCCVGFGIIFISGQTRFRLMVIGCCLLGLVIITYFPEYFVMFNRVEDVNDSLGVRARIWKEGYLIFSLNPLWGIGTDNYQQYILKHYNFGYYVVNDNEIVNYGTESGYIKILAETGIFGLINTILLVLTPVFIAIRSFIKREVNYNIFFSIAGIAAWATAFFTLTSLNDKRTMILLATLICFLIYANSTAKKVYE